MGTRTEIPTNNNGALDYSKIKIGVKALEDAVINFGSLKKINSRFTNKETIQKALMNGDLETLVEASNFYANVSGIYGRLCNHFSSFYRYDWMITPYIKSDSLKQDKIVKNFEDNLTYLDNFKVKQYFCSVAKKVIVNGSYYGYIIHSNDTAYVQELPQKYCRSRFSVKGKPAIEFQMKFFDDLYREPSQRFAVLKLFPADFQKGYLAYHEGRLPPQFSGDTSGWYLLDPELAFKFSFYDTDYPPFVSVIPHLIDLDAAQELDRKKMAQKLLKIIIQKMPLDKNGELIFDVDEAQALHNNAVRMLGKAIGIDVLTTFAEVDVADLADKSTATSIDELEKVERTVFNESGTAQNIFNTDGNLALEKSILDDEANLYYLIQQFESFLNDIIKPLNKTPKKMYCKVQILPTTIYNYKEMAKLYKEQSQLGYSKMMPQVALGQPQSAILATAKFENDILDLVNVFTPLKSSNTMSANDQKGANGNDNNKQKSNPIEEKKTGRSEKPDDEKSEKTIANKESMS